MPRHLKYTFYAFSTVTSSVIRVMILPAFVTLNTVKILLVESGTVHQECLVVQVLSRESCAHVRGVGEGDLCGLDHCRSTEVHSKSVHKFRGHSFPLIGLMYPQTANAHELRSVHSQVVGQEAARDHNGSVAS